MSAYDDRQRSLGSRPGAAADTEAAATAGRSTLTEQLEPAWQPVWEPITDVPPLPVARAAVPAPIASAAAAAPATPTPAPPPVDAEHPAQQDDPEALERIYGDQHHDPHSPHYEVKHKHAEKHWAKQDQYNRGAVHSDKATRHVAGRPGVVANGRGLFMINKPHVTRYTFVKHGHTNVAQPFDVIDRDKLTQTNWKAIHKPTPADHNERVLVNPSTPRPLEIEGKSHTCVLTWVDGKSAAWMKVDDLEHGAAIAAAAHARAIHEDPHASSHDPDNLAHHTTHYVVRNDRVGQTDPGHKKPRVLAPGATGGDNLEHYLSKDLRKPGFDDQGKELGKNVTRSFVSICMNLPERNTPPVAIDTAMAGESFFVMNDHSFHRETAVFESGHHKSNVLEKWVFGYLGMRDAGGKLKPDPTRRGWVPLRVLAEAAHLETHDVEQRKPK